MRIHVIDSQLVPYFDLRRDGNEFYWTPKDKRMYECIELGCSRGKESGHALYRTSAKGEFFEGKCELHYEGVPDPITQAIEKRNLAQR